MTRSTITPIPTAEVPAGTSDALCNAARRVIQIEAEALTRLGERINSDFASACKLVLDARGRIVVVGMGKSGLIGRKIAATLASTGTPAMFVHPGEASHGDLGMITSEDVVIALSNSGETNEILTILPSIKRLGTRIVAMTGNASSQLGRAADVHLDVSVEKEACPMNLAPTASSTATLAMGDALAIALLEARGFTADDFAYSHPGGTLGRRLLLRISNVMHTGDSLPACAPDTTLADALVVMTATSLGMVIITDDEEAVIGVFTDGDLRRVLAERVDPHDISMAAVMTKGGVSINPGQLATEALDIMQRRKIFGLPVVDGDGRLVGALNMHDLLRAGVY